MRELAPGTDRWGADGHPGREGRWTYTVEAWSDPVATWRHTPGIKIPAGIDIEPGAGGRRAAARAGGRRGAQRDRARAAVLAAADALRDDAAAGRPTGYAAALTPEVAAVLDRHPLRELVTRLRAAAAAGRAGAGAVRVLVRVLPALRGRGARRAPPARHLPHRRAAAAGDRGDGLRRGLPAADPPDRHDLPQGPQQHPDRRARRRRLALGDRLPGGRPRRRPPRPGHAGGLRRLRGRGRASWAGDRPRLRAAVLPRPPLGAQAPRVVPPPRRTARSRTRRTRRRSTRTSTRSPSTRTCRAWSPRPLRVLRHWMAHGVRIFRVDNPHTKPVVFWERVIADINRTDPDVIFLAEAFTRPAMMHTLAQIGFQQSYTYFTWRNTKEELTDYLTELSGEAAALHAAQLLRQHPGHPARLPAARRPARLRGPGRPGSDPLPHLGRLRGYELCENTPAAGGQRGVPGLREVPAQAPRLGSGRARGPQPGPADHPAQRDPAGHPGPAAAAQPPLPRHGQRLRHRVQQADGFEHGSGGRQPRPPPHPGGHGVVGHAATRPGRRRNPVRARRTHRRDLPWGRTNYVRLEPGRTPAHVFHVRRPASPPIGGSRPP